MSYDPETGLFRWTAKVSSKVVIGRVVGSMMRNGYINIRLRQHQALAHHLAWLFVYGEWPTEIDHKNGVRDDNRIINLRSATRSDNTHNLAKPSHGRTSRFKGVSWDSKKGKWRAQICINGKRLQLGRYGNQQAAAAVYDDAARRLFGEFARVNL